MNTTQRLWATLAMLLVSHAAWAEICGENQYVFGPGLFDDSFSCLDCPSMMTNDAGDDTADETITSCDLVNEPLVNLSFEAPSTNDVPAMVNESGWNLTLKAMVPYANINFDDGGGFWRFAFPSRKSASTAGYLFFENPEECLRLNDGSSLGDCPGIFPRIDWQDSRYIKYYSDVDDAGVPDNRGDSDLRDALTYDNGSRGPEIQKTIPTPDLLVDGGSCVPGTDSVNCIRFGPDMGGEVEDGWGIGTDDDLPALFLYTDKGIGLVWDEPFFELAEPAAVQNLAGMINSVSYELSDISSKSFKKPGEKGKPEALEAFKIWAHMNVVAGVFNNMVQADPNGNAGYGSWSYRLDGGEPTNLPADAVVPLFLTTCPDAVMVGWLRRPTYEVRAFLVSGTAPAQLSDFNMDGMVNVQDAIDDPDITVISNEATISFLQYADNLTSATAAVRATFADFMDPPDTQGPCGNGQGASATRSPPR